MTYLLWCVGWIRVPGYSGSFFPFTTSSLPSALLLRAVLPKVAPAQIQGRLPLPSLLQTPKGKGEGNKASSVGSLSLGCVFLHIPWSSSSPVLCSHDGICNFVARWQQKRRKEGGDTIVAVITTGSFTRFLCFLKR
jgi:hypothetical protein